MDYQLFTNAFNAPFRVEVHLAHEMSAECSLHVFFLCSYLSGLQCSFEKQVMYSGTSHYRGRSTCPWTPGVITCIVEESSIRLWREKLFAAITISPSSRRRNARTLLTVTGVICFCLVHGPAGVRSSEFRAEVSAPSSHGNRANSGALSGFHVDSESSAVIRY